MLVNADDEAWFDAIMEFLDDVYSWIDSVKPRLQGRSIGATSFMARAPIMRRQKMPSGRFSSSTPSRNSGVSSIRNPLRSGLGRQCLLLKRMQAAAALHNPASRSC